MPPLKARQICQTSRTKIKVIKVARDVISVIDKVDADRVSQIVSLTAAQQAMRGWLCLLSPVPGDGGCSLADVEFLYPSSNYNRAAIISQIAVAGRVMMNMVRTEAEDKAQDYILRAPTEVGAASVLRTMVSQLAGIAEPDDGEQFGSLEVCLTSMW